MLMNYSSYSTVLVLMVISTYKTEYFMIFLKKANSVLFNFSESCELLCRIMIYMQTLQQDHIITVLQ